MKREDLTKLGVADDVVDKIMALHGSDIETHKTKLTTAQAEAEGLKGQLTEANKTIDGFKGMNIDQIKASADEWKTKAEKAAQDAQSQISAIKFDHALESALTGAKAKNAKAVKALLDANNLKLNEDGTILGLDEQLKKVKEGNDYLFESETATPRVVAGGNNQTVLKDPMVTAMRKAAGLPIE